jgi:hypothetical protein
LIPGWAFAHWADGAAEMNVPEKTETRTTAALTSMRRWMVASLTRIVETTYVVRVAVMCSEMVPTGVTLCLKPVSGSDACAGVATGSQAIRASTAVTPRERTFMPDLLIGTFLLRTRRRLAVDHGEALPVDVRS